MTLPRGSLPPASHDEGRLTVAALQDLLRAFGSSMPLDRETTLDDLVATAGEPALMAVVLYLESWLPEPFPEELIAQVDTLGELLDFAATKFSRHRNEVLR